MRKSVPYFVFFAFHCWTPTVVAVDSLLGVDPSKRTIYETAIHSASLFACLDGSKNIPAASINDDFCDCNDGSDEPVQLIVVVENPGTSACSNGVFYCVNEGHIGAQIHSSRVNDGICDPECCDGSDEYSDLIKCPNVCAKAAAAFKKSEDEKSNVLQKGLKIKEEYIKYAAKAKGDRSRQIKAFEFEKWNITGRIEELKGCIAEQYESQLNALKAEQTKKDAVRLLPAKLATCNRHNKRLLEDVETLNSRVSELTSILDHFATLKAVEEGAAFEALLRDKPILKETLATFEEFKAKLKQDGGLDDGRIDVPELPEIENSVDELYNESEIESHEIDLSLISKNSAPTLDYCVDASSTFIQCVLQSTQGLIGGISWTAKYPFVWPGWTKLRTSIASSFVVLSKSEEDEILSKDAAKARAKLSEIERKKNDVEQKLEALNKKLKLDLGPKNVWDKLIGECFKIDSFEYSYEICLFEKATQKNIGGGGGTDLGKFTRWGARNEGVGSLRYSDSKYLHMMFENGAQCWNGPQRSVEVQFECGSANKVIGVSEPSKCEYAMKMQTPAVCDAEATDAEDNHDEF
ncbi:hypothetical protein HK100_009441 [Physocladia obscura]|uniref:Glucosidase 2 subunit beta n=1 Tax=Physocladia obscura TaxID=109957 RepID=A0AAD5T4D3_9FUNG|nr:hypothetical protein HK100_009441 [Physocladia obscura]